MNKLLLLLTLVFISFSSYGANVCLEAGDVQKRGGTYYLVNQEKPFTGNNACQYRSNGQLHSQGKFKKGKKDGKWIFWYESGQKKSEKNWKKGKENGKSITWYEDGQRKTERNWRNNELDGTNISWYENGQKERESNYKKGKENGTYITWYENGQKEREANYKNDKKDGTDIYWNRKGQIEQEFFYLQGLQFGPQVWYVNGQVQSIDVYNECGKKIERTGYSLDSDFSYTDKYNPGTCNKDDKKRALKEQEERFNEYVKSFLNRPNYETNFKGWVDKYGYK